MKKRRYDFITIGELSGLTGVNAKSLRYYEKIGVLRPAYINPENGYRFYTYSQIFLVSAIQFYVEMDIPLSTIHNYIDKENGGINCREQISYGIENAKQKLQLISDKISHAEMLMEEIDRSDKVLSTKEPITMSLSARNCILVASDGKQTEQKYYSVLHRLLLNIKKAGYQIGSESGLLYKRMNEKWHCYIFVEVNGVDYQFPDSSFSFYKIDGGDYRCKETSFFDISPSSLMDSVFEGKEPKIIILSELFSSVFDYRKPRFELRWSVS